MSLLIGPEPGESICTPGLGSKTLKSPQALWLWELTHTRGLWWSRMGYLVRGNSAVKLLFIETVDGNICRPVPALLEGTGLVTADV